MLLVSLLTPFEDVFERGKALEEITAPVYPAFIWHSLPRQSHVPCTYRYYSQRALLLTAFKQVTPWMINRNCIRYLSSNPGANRVRLLNQIAFGIEYLHNQEIIHGDLRAVRILLL